MEKKLLFALDIGTRSIVGLIGEKTAEGIRVLGGVRHEHTTRAMLDGQHEPEPLLDLPAQLILLAPRLRGHRSTERRRGIDRGEW